MESGIGGGPGGGGPGGVLGGVGLMEIFRTDNKLLNGILFTLLLPLLAVIGQAANNGLPGLLEWLSKTYYNRRFATRTIEYTFNDTSFSWRVGTPSEDKNQLLQKAVNLYIASLAAEGKVKIDNGLVKFIAVDDSAEKESKRSPWYRDDDKKAETSPLQQLKRFSISVVPEQGRWVELGPSLQMRMSSRERRSGKDDDVMIKITREFEFVSPRPGGAKTIDTFLSAALEWYRSRLDEDTDDNRYLYIMRNKQEEGGEGGEGKGRGGGGKGKGGGGGGGGGGSSGEKPTYRRYKLTDNKTMSNLFFPEKAALLELVDQFSHKQGRYAVEGYPHKLGLLLWGEPGTGKTSLIKALAHYTRRHIVTLDLSKLNTNEELYEVMFQTDYAVEGLDFPVKMGFSEVIFIMEDIDAASDIVQSRASVVESNEEYKLAVLGVKGPDKDKQGPSDNEATETVNKPADTSPSTIDVAAAVATATAKALSNALDPETEEEKKKKAKKADALDLSGLLNVLDGIVDTPGRIVIMTTNHPEKLDKALIRPGRIDKPIYLGFMSGGQAAQMIEHYFKTEVTAAQMDRLVSFLGTGKKLAPPFFGFDLGTSGGRTPASVEQQCSEFSTVDSLLDALEGKILSEYDKMNALAASKLVVPNAATGETVDAVASSFSSSASAAPGIIVDTDAATSSSVDNGHLVLAHLPDHSPSFQRTVNQKKEQLGRALLGERQFSSSLVRSKSLPVKFSIAAAITPSNHSATTVATASDDTPAVASADAGGDRHVKFEETGTGTGTCVGGVSITSTSRATSAPAALN